MRIGFSSLACPTWDLKKIITEAGRIGYDGIELRGLRGDLHLPLVPALAGDPARVRDLLAEHNVEIVCLGTSATLDSKDRREIRRQKATILEFVELAASLGCPRVRLFVGEVQRRDTRRAALARSVEHLSALVPTVSRCRVTLLVENGGDVPGSEDMWHLIDAIGHPAVRCCWNQLAAMTIQERPTVSIPRLGGKIGMVHLCDAKLDEFGLPQEYTPLGKGDGLIARQIELLKGIAYDGDLMFEWPRLWMPSLASPESVLPETFEYLCERLNEKQPVLSAYKGDKHAPKLPLRDSSRRARCQSGQESRAKE